MERLKKKELKKIHADDKQDGITEGVQMTTAEKMPGGTTQRDDIGKAVLERDVLRTIAEKLMLVKVQPEALHVVDLRDIAKLNLMFSSRLACNAVLLQFRRMNLLYFNNLVGLQLREPMNLKDEDGLQFFKRFWISEWMFFWLLAADVLRYKDLDICGDFDLRMPVSEDETPVDSLVKLILFDGSPLNQTRASKWNLGGVKMELDPMKHSCNYLSMGALDRLLNLNIGDTLLDLRGIYTDFVFPATLRRISADRTEKLTVYLRTRSPDPLTDLLNFPREQLRALLRYLLDCCANVKKINIRFSIDNTLAAVEFEQYAVWILAFEQFATETLTGIESGERKIVLSNVARFPKSTLKEAAKNGHAIFKMGAPMHNLQKDAVISRQMKLSEKIHTVFALYGI